MGILELAAASFFAGFSGAVMPGPLTMVTMYQASRRGVLAGILLALGHGAAEAPLFLALAVGFERVFNEGVVAAIGVLGGATLIWMAYSMIRVSGRAIEDPANLSGVAASPGRMAFLGVVTSASNPYWLIWWLGVGASIIKVSVGLGPLGAFSAYASHVSSDLVWFAFVAWAVSRGRRLFSTRGYRVFLLASSIPLLLLGAYFAYSGLVYFLAF